MKNKTALRISFSLKNTYRVNAILFSLKQIPLLRRLLPASLYKSRGLKVFASLLAGIWELLSVFLGKFLYFFTMICGLGVLYDKLPADRVFLHILLFLTLIGSFLNTDLFNPTREKYYAVILMRMDARKYTLVNYLYSLFKTSIGFLPFTLLFGIDRGVPVWLSALLPFSVAGAKLSFVALTLWDYERRERGYNENKFSKLKWGAVALLLAAAYGLPALGFALPETVSAILFLLFLPLGALGLWKVLSFQGYREVNRELLSGLTQQTDTAAEVTKRENEKKISADTSIYSGRRGFEYLNELFIKRHRKILWSSTKKISYVCAFLAAGMLFLICWKPELKAEINAVVMTSLPYFVFILYAINRGTGFTQALFMNCDHSLLTYSFYKRPSCVLKLFRIRLREIMKINALPALILGVGLALILFVSGGTENPLNYAILIISLLCMSLFFSVHYLTVYYLLQPYNAGTEIKSGTYRLVMTATYLVCFCLMQLRMSTLVFGILTIVFCVLYSLIACVLVYKLAPKTFRLRT